MTRGDGQSVEREHASPTRERDIATEYRQLVSILAGRAARLGSRDPEAVAQEALRRSLDNAKSRQAVDYYLGEELPSNAAAPEWPLDQLLAWLHGVLQNVVREEQKRAGFRREVSVVSISETADVAPTVLEVMVEREMRSVVFDCFANLDADYRKVLQLRMDGLKYNQIARRLGMSENTVATWVSRGIRELGRQIRKRTGESNG